MKSGDKSQPTTTVSNVLLSSPLILEQPNSFLTQIIPVKCEESGEEGWNVYHYTQRGWQFYDNVSRRTAEALTTSEGTKVFLLHR